jgi:hypothetical protein
MSAEALALLESKLKRLRAEHESALLFAGRDAMKMFDANRKITFGQSCAKYIELVGAQLETHIEKVQTEALSVVEQLLLPLTLEVKGKVIALTKENLPPAIYPERFQIFIDSLTRHASQSSQSVSAWGIRTDLDAARHHVGTHSYIAHATAKLSDELEVLRLRSAGPMPASETKLEQANSIVKLEPNLFGVGFNLNYLIRRKLGKRK